MTRDEIDEVLQRMRDLRVLRGPANLSEPAHVTEFSAVRGDRRVVIKVLDYGPEDCRQTTSRYAVRATVEDEHGFREATGNLGRTVLEALQDVHWNKLDSPD